MLHRSGARGLGLSYIDGIYLALRTDATHICQMDADLSHDPDDLPRLIAATADADVAIGSRYVPGGRIENWAAHRRMLSAFANWYIRSVTGLTIRDCTGGFRCWRREVLERLPLGSLRSDGYAFVVELVFGSQSRGLPVQRGADHVRRTTAGRLEALGPGAARIRSSCPGASTSSKR